MKLLHTRYTAENTAATGFSQVQNKETVSEMLASFHQLPAGFSTVGPLKALALTLTSDCVQKYCSGALDLSARLQEFKANLKPVIYSDRQNKQMFLVPAHVPTSTVMSLICCPAFEPM